MRLLLRRLHLIPETVLSRDRYLHFGQLNPLTKSAGLAFSKYEEVYKRVLPVEEAAQRAYNKKYALLWKRLAGVPRGELCLSERSLIIQQFVGDKFPLLLPESMAILCGSSDFDVWVTSVGNSNNTEKFKNPTQEIVLVSQWRLRQLGREFFSFNCSVCTIFNDDYYLALSIQELHQALLTVEKSDLLVREFMKRHALTKALVPFRLSPKSKNKGRCEAVRNIDDDATIVGSFYTMLGLLVIKFGAARVRDELWLDRIYDSPSGILKIVMDMKVNYN